MTETIGTPVQEVETVRDEKERISSLTVTSDEKEITFFAYSDEGRIWGHRMEISTEDTHVVPADITAITDNTHWNFTGCKDGSVMFEGVLDV